MANVIKEIHLQLIVQADGTKLLPIGEVLKQLKDGQTARVHVSGQLQPDLVTLEGRSYYRRPDFDYQPTVEEIAAATQRGDNTTFLRVRSSQ